MADSSLPSEEITKPIAADPIMSRHAAIGALVDKFYKELTPIRRGTVDAFLPPELVTLLKEG